MIDPAASTQPGTSFGLVSAYPLEANGFAVLLREGHVFTGNEALKFSLWERIVRFDFGRNAEESTRECTATKLRLNFIRDGFDILAL